MKAASQKTKAPGVQAKGSQVKDQTNQVDDSKPGHLPKRQATVLAEVLARLLNYEKLTGLEAVAAASTTRLAHHVHALGRDYGWRIDRHDKIIGTRDGRVQEVSEYWLDPRLIEAAVAQGARVWCAEVWKARADLRTQGGDA